jgi:putative membrane-bound dehydrogenase-like protein
MGYPFPDDPGRIAVLDDKDGDGFYETRTVFAEGFAMANSLLPYDGGLLVVSPPDILFLKDTDGDDVADVREAVITGVAVANPEDSINGLNYGLDNWIYAVNGGNSGILTWPGGGEPIPVRADDVRFNLRSHRIERTGRAAQGFELAFDAWGRMFNTNNTHPLNHLVFPGSFIEGLPQPREGTLHALPDELENGLVRLYPIGEQATRVNHPEQSGYFSGACAPKCYTGGAFGPEFDGNVFVCDVVLNLVHRRILEPEGTTFVARRDGRTRQEFLASTDRAFRPVNMAIAPDGSLWVVDMHRVVIEHPEWIPDEIEATLDLNAGKDQGRLFRITPKGGLPRVTPNFRRDRLDDAVAALEHPNSWWRLTAQRLLVEWNDPAAVPALQRLVRESAMPIARAHALWTLNGIDQLDDATLLAAFRDTPDELLEQTIQLAIPRINRSQEIADAVAHLYTRPSARVRLWAALAYAEFRDARFDLMPQLLTILSEHAGDPMMRLALLPGLVQDAHRALTALLSEDRPNDGGDDMLALLAEASASRVSLKEAQHLLGVSASVGQTDPRGAEAFLSGFAAGLNSTRAAFDSKSERDALAESIAPLLRVQSTPVLREAWSVARALELRHVSGQDEALERARAVVEDASGSLADRVDSLRILEFAPFDDRAELLYALLDTRGPRELQREAILQLQREGSRDVAQRLIALWRTLGPETRPVAGDVLLYKRSNNDLLLTALEQGKISLGEMNFHLERRRVLLHSKNPEIVQRAEALFTDAGVVTRKDAIVAMQPALALSGDPVRGKQVFADMCMRCHRIGNEGGDLAPNLTEIYRKSRETLMFDIIDPNAAVDQQYVSYTVERKNGELVSGIIGEESDEAVTIRDANGVQTVVPRADIREMISDGLSLMPEELESGLDHQAMADLLAYLQERK